MAPLLLDHRSLFRAGLYLGLCGVLIFFGGYYTGYQKAAQNGDIAMSRTMALALPGAALADASEFEPQVPVTTEPGADIDVDSPDNTVAKTTHSHDIDTEQAKPGVLGEQSNPPSVANKMQVVNTQPEKAISNNNSTEPEVASSKHASGSVSIVNKVATEKPDLQLASLKVTPEVLESTDDATIVQNQLIDTADANSARYTIQVGMYADMGNAERRVAELEAQQLSAYIDAYTNKQDKERFNVRFGYFNSMSSARKALAVYENQFSGSGYIASMRRN
jgi:cell division protein FtsN